MIDLGAPTKSLRSISFRGWALPLALMAVGAVPALALADQPTIGAATSKEPPPKDADAEASEPAKPKPPAKWEIAKPERRGNFAVGFGIGAGIGASSGYPNDSKKIGVAQYYNSTGVTFGTQTSLWIGGALADWLTFGAGGGYSWMPAKGEFGVGPSAFFHTDIYPFYPLGGALRDLGAMFDFGLGFPKVTQYTTNTTLQSSALGSFLMAGICWEGIKAWKLRMGPYAAFHYMFSDSIERPLGTLGFRITLYSSP